MLPGVDGFALVAGGIEFGITQVQGNCIFRVPDDIEIGTGVPAQIETVAGRKGKAAAVEDGSLSTDFDERGMVAGRQACRALAVGIGDGKLAIAVFRRIECGGTACVEPLDVDRGSGVGRRGHIRSPAFRESQYTGRSFNRDGLNGKGIARQRTFVHRDIIAGHEPGQLHFQPASGGEVFL